MMLMSRMWQSWAWFSLAPYAMPLAGIAASVFA
jgi:hypothetical protein